MRVAVAAAGRDLEAATDPRFGRCQAFVIVDTDDMSWEVVDNTAAAQGSGAGIAAAQLVANKGAEAVIAAHLGPNAFTALAAGGLKVYGFGGGSVREAVAALQAGALAEMSQATVASHFGMGVAGPAGAGAAPPAPATSASEVKAQVTDLEAQSQELRAQLDRLSSSEKA